MACLGTGTTEKKQWLNPSGGGSRCKAPGAELDEVAGKKPETCQRVASGSSLGLVGEDGDLLEIKIENPQGGFNFCQV